MYSSSSTLLIAADYNQKTRFVKLCTKELPCAACELFRQMDYNTAMIEMNIPGRGPLSLKHLVMDVNGTIAIDGTLIEGLARRITNLNDRLAVHLLTADTHGGQALIDQQLNLTAIRVQSGREAGQKARFVRQLGAETVVAIGQGANDAEMLKTAALGICVLSQEGVATSTLSCADILAPDIFAAFDLLDRPLRIVASLRT